MAKLLLRVLDMHCSNCAMTIEGHRVLLAYQPVNQSGEFQSNRYLIFPTAQEIQAYELDNPRRRKSRNFPADSPSAAFPNTVNPNSAKPNTVQPHSEKPHSKKNQPKVDPSEPKPQRKKKQSSVAGVDGVLAHRATIVEDMPVEQVEVFDQIDMLLAVIVVHREIERIDAFEILGIQFARIAYAVVHLHTQIPRCRV